MVDVVQRVAVGVRLRIDATVEPDGIWLGADLARLRT